MTVIIDGTTGASAVQAGVVVQAGLAAGVAGNGPAFSAYQSSSQTPSASTWTKLQFQTEEFDTNSCFDSTTNYRFTPTISGYYQISGALQNNSISDVAIGIYKNGSIFKQINNKYAVIYNTGSISCLIYLNGSTDYVELYCNLSALGAINPVAATTFFQASLVRAA